MVSITVYLKTPLFTIKDAPHAPTDAAVVTGRLEERGAAGLTVRVDQFLDERGRALNSDPLTLLIPFAKIDHAIIREG